VAGKGLFGEERLFLDMAKNLGLANAIDYVGWLEESEAAEHLAAASVALFPFDDTLVNRTRSPMKLLDLMAAGLPVVGEAVGEVAEVVDDGVTGRLVKPGDGAAMAAAVIDLLGDEARRREVGRAAQARVADSYSWSRRVVDLEAVYTG
jgi:glycosyltransferase involved in cell wall biosynthesis